MRCLLLVLVSLATVFYRLQAQEITVIDKITAIPIENVFIYNLNNTYSIQTSGSGKADIGLFSETDLIVFQHPAYIDLTLEVNTLKDMDYTIRLEEKIINIDEVIISANKWEQNADEIPNEILTISPKDISFSNAQTSADVLSSTGQVFVQKSQLGGGSPKLRGFAANSVLIVVDGVRMNNAIYRNGNLQNIISIDPNVLEGAEVAFGPGSVIYGSDALGGVMDFHTLDPYLSEEKGKVKFDGAAFTRYATANNEKTGHAHLSIGNKKLGFFTSLTYSDFDDLRAGSNRHHDYPDFGKRPEYVIRIDGQDEIVPNDDENLQKFSGFDQLNLMNKLYFKASEAVDLTYAFYYGTTSDIPRYDRLTETDQEGELIFAEWYYGPQKWQLHQFKTELLQPTRFYDQARVILAYQDVEESRNDRRLGDNRLRTRTEKVDVYSANVDLDKSLGKNTLFYGVEYVYNEVASTGFRENLVTGAVTPTTPRYPDGGSDYLSLAGYASMKRHLNEKLIFNIGARYSYVKLTAEVLDDSALDFSFSSFDIANSALTGSLGLVYRHNSSLRLNTLLSSGFRSPNIDDVGKVFDFSDGEVQVPNENLKPEYTYNLEFGAEIALSDDLKIHGVVYGSLLKDAMVRDDFTYNGQDSILFEGEMAKTVALVNTGQAYIYGASMQIYATVNDHFALTSTLTFNDGEDTENNEPLRHTTPVFGKTSLIYKKDRLRSEFYAEYNGWRRRQDIPASEIDDKPHLYTVDGSPAWYTLNFKGTYQINRLLQFSAGVENILDKHYRPYSSGISAPGRNYIFSLRANLNY